MSTMVNETDGLRLLSLGEQSIVSLIDCCQSKSNTDGGGIRGLSSLLILKHIMYRVMQKENSTVMPRPCEYFSMMAGTGTGG